MIKRTFGQLWQCHRIPKSPLLSLLSTQPGTSAVTWGQELTSIQSKWVKMVGITSSLPALNFSTWSPSILSPRVYQLEAGNLTEDTKIRKALLIHGHRKKLPRSLNHYMDQKEIHTASYVTVSWVTSPSLHSFSHWDFAIAASTTWLTQWPKSDEHSVRAILLNPILSAVISQSLWDHTAYHYCNYQPSIFHSLL